MYHLCIFRTTCTVAKYVPAPSHSEVGSNGCNIHVLQSKTSRKWVSRRCWKGQSAVQTTPGYQRCLCCWHRDRNCNFQRQIHSSLGARTQPFLSPLWLFECLSLKFLWMELAKEWPKEKKQNTIDDNEGFYGGIFVFIDYLKNQLLVILRCFQRKFSGLSVSSNILAKENSFQACELGKHQSMVSVTFCLPYLVGRN